MTAETVSMHSDALGVEHIFLNRPDVVAYWQSRGWTLAADQDTTDTTGTALVIVHGDTAGTARPDAEGPVVWIGAAQPTHLDPARDVWAPTVPTTV